MTVSGATVSLVVLSGDCFWCHGVLGGVEW